MRLVFGGAAAGLLVGTLACSSFDGGGDVSLPARGAEAQQTTAANAPGSTAPDWSCLGAVVPPAAPLAVGADRIVLSVQSVDLATGLPRAGVQARACGQTDVDCARPLAGPVMADTEGWFDLPLLAGFTGFIEVTGPDVTPGLVYLSEPLTADSAPGYPYTFLPYVAIEALGRIVDVPLDPSLGLISVRTFDCKGGTAAGVSLSKEGPGIPWYFISGLPSVTERATDSQGLAGYANAPVGLNVVDVLSPQGRSLSGPQSLVVRPGWISHSFVKPRRVPVRSP